MRVAIATGAREEELYLAAPSQVDHNRRQMTLIGKGRKGVKKRRVIDLEPFGGYRLILSLPPSPGKALLLFQFHDLRHLHAVNWLKDGRSIYDLQRRLGHTSIKTTEEYCKYLTAEEDMIVKGLADPK